MANGTISKNMVLLWENPNPSASFASQTINVNLAGYNMFAVVAIWSVTSGSRIPFCFIPAEDGTYGIPMQSAASNRTGGRDATFNISNGTVYFGNASYNGAQNNGYCVPYQIIGIKA